MKLTPKKLFPFLKNRYSPRGARHSYSASGEDLIMLEALERFGVHRPHYIDIGAHHPIFGNNTYLFYRRGSTGLIVEPDKNLCEIISKKRPKDSVLNAGAGPIDSVSDFFIFPQTTRSTFSQEQAAEWSEKSGQTSIKKSLPIISLDTLIQTHFKNIVPDLISIDAEGYDLEILRGFSWKIRPKVFCIESIADDDGKIFSHNKEIYRIFEQRNYAAYGETSANTIFVDTLA